ncbi:alpha-1,3-arabinosyltransferase XAT2-like [Coffea arabica]|uniref:Alpha-1,3-arabinosyltransferase XAT2-like n=1 Tax=Coffea arabica TaxID=13443 RepID=A0ABM4U1I0_COFAR
MYDPIFAKSFSKYEQKRFGFWAILVCTIMAVSIFLELKPGFHPLAILGNAMNLQLSIDAAQDKLAMKDEDISLPFGIHAVEQAKEGEQTDMLRVNDMGTSSPSATEAVESDPTNTSIVKDIDTNPPLATQAKKVETPSEELGEPACNFLGPLSDYCEIKGDIRIEANSSTVFIVSPQTTIAAKNKSWSTRPYARKGNGGAMISVKKWTIKLVSHNEDNIPRCSINHSIPSILFSTGGFSGNPFHDFSDLLVPIYSTSQEFGGEVQFLATDHQHWWISKYQMLFSRLSRHEIIAIDKEKEIHCYSRMVAGLKSYKEFIIDSSKFPHGLSMNHFRQFLRSTYSLERTRAIKLRKGGGQKPRLMLISRGRTRKLTNEGEITRMARKLGYEVIVAEAGLSTNLTSFAQLVNSCDVLMGVHGAGLTNMVFLPDKAILVQIIPLGGIDGLARVDFGIPSKDMHIRYLEYKIEATESSLIEQYPLDHAVFRDPSSFHKQGWGAIRSVYLDKQNVKIDLHRFKSTLVKALKLLRRH